jgi:hypothetical protein
MSTKRGRLHRGRELVTVVKRGNVVPEHSVNVVKLIDDAKHFSFGHKSCVISDMPGRWHDSKSVNHFVPPWFQVINSN